MNAKLILVNNKYDPDIDMILGLFFLSEFIAWALYISSCQKGEIVLNSFNMGGTWAEEWLMLFKKLGSN